MRDGLVGPVAHVVVGGGDDLVDAATRLGELRQIAEINGRDLGAWRKRGQPLAAAGEGADFGAGRHRAGA